MTWMLAITIICITPPILAFALFLIIYFAELRREKQLIKDYQTQIDKGAAALKDLRLVYADGTIAPLDPVKKATKPVEPPPADDPKKRSIN